MPVTIDELAAKFEPKIERAFFESLRRLKNQTSMARLQRILNSKGAQGLVDTMAKMDEVFAQELKPIIDDAITAGGRSAIQIMPAQGILLDTFAFNPFDYGAANYISNYENLLIRQISNNTFAAIRQGVLRSIKTGVNPLATVKDFRSTLGLTKHQERAVANYRSYLENLDKAALERALRDKRFDPTVQRAIKNRRNLKKAQIDKMVTRYKEKYIKYRGETIARTEALRAVSIGQDEAIKQMITSGTIDTKNMRQFWVFARDERTRIAHKQIPGMNKDGIPLTEKFKTPLGPLAYPRDPNGSGDNTINCRCRRVFRMAVAEAITPEPPKPKPKKKPKPKPKPKPKKPKSKMPSDATLKKAYKEATKGSALQALRKKIDKLDDEVIDLTTERRNLFRSKEYKTPAGKKKYKEITLQLEETMEDYWKLKKKFNIYSDTEFKKAIYPNDGGKARVAKPLGASAAMKKRFMAKIPMIEKMYSKKVLDKLPTIYMDIEKRGTRAFYRNSTMHLATGDTTGTLMHEFSHGVEEHMGYFMHAAEFRGMRAKRSGSDLTQIYRGSSEYGYKDEFFTHYCGKVYQSNNTEIISCGVEQMHDDPLQFYRTDKEYFKFILQVMYGEVKK